METKKISIKWNLETPERLLERYVLNLDSGSELVICGFDKPTISREFGETMKNNKIMLVYTASGIMDSLIKKDGDFEHEINTQRHEYTIRRLK
ncbi:hypothetical protein HYT23_03105 [Candidatus Pacearchaeota archaeon]|nr:hypothetical protein [Candidatus Pacearchaeota archaeon]